MSEHVIVARGRDQWAASTATCSCGLLIREPSGKQRDEAVKAHLAETGNAGYGHCPCCGEDLILPGLDTAAVILRCSRADWDDERGVWLHDGEVVQ